MALFGSGAVLGGLLVLGRRPGRPLVVAVACGFLSVAPVAALAVTAPLPVVCAAAVVAGIGQAVNMSLWMTTVQSHVPLEALSRVNSFVTLGAFAGGPVGMALAGPVAEATSISTVLGFAAGWQLLACTAVLAVPSVRAVRGGRSSPQSPEGPQPPEQERRDVRGPERDGPEGALEGTRG